MNEHEGMQWVEGHGWLPVMIVSEVERAIVDAYDRPNPYLTMDDSTAPWDAWNEGWDAHVKSLEPAPIPATEPVLLYGMPGDETLEFDPSTVHERESWLNAEDDTWTHRESTALSGYMEPIPPPGFSYKIEEWSTTEPRKHFPDADDVIERVLESFGDNDVSEDCYEHACKYQDEPDVVAAFEHAIALLASKISYRMADRHLRDLVVTFDDNGEPLLDGEPMYVKREPDDA